jgi:hypothetical protein
MFHGPKYGKIRQEPRESLILTLLLLVAKNISNDFRH